MKKNNKGFSVITVIVAIAFIGIMAMIVLYMSMSNFHMKVTDLKAKDSFYKAENALDEIKSGLQEDVGEAMTDAYVEVLETYQHSGASEGEKQSKFQEKYVKNLRDRLKLKGTTDRYDMNKIQGYVDLLGEIDDTKESLMIVNPENTEPILSKGGTESGLVLKNLKVVYVDPKGRASIIETDIRLGMPHVTFPDAFTPPDLMKMNSIAGRGIICGEDAEAENIGKPIEIKGNVYAGQKIDANGIVFPDGKSIDIKDGQAVTVTNGEKERLVCLGEISVGNKGSFLIQEQRNCGHRD